MAVSVICKLLHGKDTLNLNSGRYCLDDGDFMPPTTARAVTYGALLAGAEAVRKRRENRAWSFSVNVAGTTASKSEAERALRNLQSFLNRAGGSTPLYVAYRNFSDYDFEPYFGQFGAFSRYEVVHGSAEVTQQYNAPLGNSSVIARIRVDLVIKPQAVGLQQQSGQAKGFIFEDFIGKADGLARGTHIGEAATNQFTNPAFMNATWNTNWTVTGTDFLVTENNDPEYVLFGDTSARCSKTTVAAGDRFTESLTLGAVTQYLSCYVKMIDGSAPTGINLWYNSGTVSTTQTAVGDGWYLLTGSATGTAGAAATGVTATSNQTVFFVDGFQATTTQNYQFILADFLGCTWASTKNGSGGTSVVGRLRYDYDYFLADRTGYTIRVAWLPNPGTTGARYFLEDDNSDFHLQLDASNQVVAQVSSGNSVTSSAITVTAGTPIILHVVYDGSNLTIYRAGTSLATDSGKVAGSSEPTWMYVGSDASITNHCGGTILGVATFRRAMSSTEVAADYAQAIQQVTDGDRLDPLPWFFTEDGDNVVDNDNYVSGGLYNYAIVGGLIGDDVDVTYKLDSSNSFILGPGVTWGSLPVVPRLFDKDILTDGNANSLLFEDGTGTADTAANSDVVNRVALSTSTATLLNTPVTVTNGKLLSEAENITGYFVAKDNNTVDTTVQIQLALDFGGANEEFVTDWRTVEASDAFRPFVTFELPLDFENYILDSERLMGFKLKAKRVTGASSANFDVSHAVWLINYAGVYTGDITASPVLDMAYGRERVLELVDDANPKQTRGRRIFNRPLLIKPERLNVLMLQHTFDNFAASKTTWTTGYNLEVEQFAVTPRFDIL